MSACAIIPHFCQRPWYSLSGYFGFKLEKSCLGNGLNGTAAKIAAYLPRMLIAFPLLMTCATLDLVGLFTLGVVVVPIAIFSGIIQSFRYGCWSISDTCEFCFYLVTIALAECISFIAYPLILLGHLLCGIIPESQRGDHGEFTARDHQSQIGRVTWSITDGSLYRTERQLDILRVERDAKMFSEARNLYPGRAFIRTRQGHITGSLLTAAVCSRNLKMVDLLIHEGATLKEMDEICRLNTLFCAFKGPPEIVKRIVELPDFDPTKIFTIPMQILQNHWPPWCNADQPVMLQLYDVSIPEIAILANGMLGLKHLQAAGFPLNYIELSAFQGFLSNLESKPNPPSENRFYKAWSEQLDRLDPQKLESDRQHLAEIIKNRKSIFQELKPYFPEVLIPIIMSY